jgi:predicted nuclease of restriction endonuclease-like (RecB) superfamily
MTSAYWEIGRRIVEHEQQGKQRAEYGVQLLERLSADLTARFGRGFSFRNLSSFRAFYLSWPILQTVSAESVAVPAGEYPPILQTVSAESGVGNAQASAGIRQTVSGELFPRTSAPHTGMPRFPLPWSHYVRLISVENPEARKFYEAEAIRAGWSVRQLDRQISSLFYERTALSRNKAAMLKKGAQPKSEDQVAPEEEIKDPLVLEFLGLKDEYSETELEEALIRHLQAFLLELGDDFAFVGRQRRLRIGDEWYRVDLLFFHRRLRCLIVIDLKLGKFSNADAGQMHTYLNYAREHWTRQGENPPVGLILCAQKNEALARYALDNLPNKVLAAEYRLALPDEGLLAEEIDRTRKAIEERRGTRPRAPQVIK